MLLERDLIQSVGFRNVREGGAITGFQLRVRMPSYRGMAASLIDGIAVRVGDLVDVGGRRAAVDLRRPDLHARRAVGERRRALAARRAGDRHRAVPGRPARRHPRGVDRAAAADVVHPDRAPAERTYRVTKHVTLSPELDGGPFQYGVSLYSFMRDYGTVLDLETALARHRRHRGDRRRDPRRGARPELPGPVARRGSTHWFRLLEKYWLEPTNYGSWIDTRLHSSGRTAAT